MEIPKFRFGASYATQYRTFVPGGNFYLQAGSTVFVVDEVVLRQRGSIAARLFDAARNSLGSNAGASITEAIDILNLDASALAHYLELVFARNEEELADIRERETWTTLHGILKTAVLFFDPLARRYALSRLDNHTDFTPQRRLTIAIKYRIEAWFERAAAEVIRAAIDRWSAQDYDELSGEVLQQIMRFKIKIVKNRVLALLNPPIASACINCEFGYYCRRKWEVYWEEWCRPVLELYIDEPTPSPDRQELLCRVEEHRGDCCESCFQSNKVLVTEKLEREDDMLRGFLAHWRDSLRFHSVEVAVEAIRHRSRVYQGVPGIELDDDMEFLTVSSEGLGSLLDL